MNKDCGDVGEGRTIAALVTPWGTGRKGLSASRLAPQQTPPVPRESGDPGFRSLVRDVWIPASRGNERERARSMPMTSGRSRGSWNDGSCACAWASAAPSRPARDAAPSASRSARPPRSARAGIRRLRYAPRRPGMACGADRPSPSGCFLGGFLDGLPGRLHRLRRLLLCQPLRSEHRHAIERGLPVALILGHRHAAIGGLRRLPVQKR